MILLFNEDFLKDGRVLLSGRRHKHILETLKSKAGDNLKVGLWGGNLGTGRVENIDLQSVLLSVNLELAPPAPLDIDLILPLPRPKVLPRVIQMVTSLGVKRTAFVNFWKVDKSYWKSHYLEDDVLKRSIGLGLEQSVDTQPPTFDFFRLFKPFAEDCLESWCGEGGGKILCHPNIQNGVSVTSIKADRKILAIGPEGGFTPYEVDTLLSRGFVGFSLMERILKLETAIPALVGRLL